MKRQFYAGKRSMGEVGIFRKLEADWKLREHLAWLLPVIPKNQ
ncbi:MAG: hypothetical protein V5804_07520 [Mucilaginibacter sp.]